MKFTYEIARITQQYKGPNEQRAARTCANNEQANN